MKRAIALLCCLFFMIPLICACAQQNDPEPDGLIQTTGTKPAQSTAEQTKQEEQTVEPSTTQAKTPLPTETSSAEPTQPSGSLTETPEIPTKEPTVEPPAEDKEIPYGVYQLVSKDGKILCSTNKISTFKANYSDEDQYNRFTIHKKPNPDGDDAVYAIYKGADESYTVGVKKNTDGSYKLTTVGERYKVSDVSLWRIENAGNGYYRFISVAASGKKSTPKCIAMRDGVCSLEDVKEDDDAQVFELKTDFESNIYYEYISDKRNIVIRIPKEYIDNKATTGAKHELMRNYANWMQEAYEAEIELTGYIPYDVIVFDMSTKQNIVAGVVNNYNFVKADKGFMQNEIKLMVLRAKKLGTKDMNFAMLHEMGHMFDSERAWCFESEAWTDLKLCYVVYKLTLTHKDTDGFIFGCSPSDYGSMNVCHTYETLAEGLDIHGPKGAMTKEYGFFGAARLFLLMTYQFDDYNGFGWEPFIKTFHSYQDEGMTQKSFEKNGQFDNWESFTDFVRRLSEYSGRDVRAEFLSDENWECYRKFYKHETTVAL